MPLLVNCNYFLLLEIHLWIWYLFVFQMIFYHMEEVGLYSSTSSLEIFMIWKDGKKSIYKSSTDYSYWKKEQLNLNSSAVFQVPGLSFIPNVSVTDKLTEVTYKLFRLRVAEPKY